MGHIWSNLKWCNSPLNGYSIIYQSPKVGRNEAVPRFWLCLLAWLSCDPISFCNKGLLAEHKGRRRQPRSARHVSDHMGKEVGGTTDMKGAPASPRRHSYRAYRYPMGSPLHPCMTFLAFERSFPSALLASLLVSLRQRRSACPDWWAQEGAPLPEGHCTPLCLHAVRLAGPSPGLGSPAVTQPCL